MKVGTNKSDILSVTTYVLRSNMVWNKKYPATTPRYSIQIILQHPALPKQPIGPVWSKVGSSLEVARSHLDCRMQPLSLSLSLALSSMM